MKKEGNLREEGRRKKTRNKEGKRKAVNMWGREERKKRRRGKGKKGSSKKRRVEEG